jgi:16S rRNA U516 pseudouridylate synthase RsuA-like enzyme
MDYIYYALNKPFGISTFVSKENSNNNINTVQTDKKMRDNNDKYKNNEEKDALSLLPSCPLVFNIGRLDKDSTGLLIFTNDGRFYDYQY